MHPVINDILEATRMRIPSIKDMKKGKVISRNFRMSIESRKQRNQIPIIAEVKPSSPARFIRSVTPEGAVEIAGQMEAGGAAAISVLTEPRFFKGSIENLNYVRQAVGIPVLRKDFIIDINQVYEAESDMLLLIAGILDDKLGDFVNEAIMCGRKTLVEVHNEKELENALSTSTDIIGINNRDLTTMVVDISTTEKLAPLINDRIIISESGISSPEDAIRMIDAGADAILVGTSIMQGNIYDRTYELVNALNR
ncbi:Indole-3-glycerol phosphate synthase [Candidatus Methanoperedens nitroreducens]|uniref:indole-3-glycerol-phosphate synthase n=1 Tax=Candidatus Methanoperedens nitratireducens TaxID=1392998 RepID=A0A062V5U4_9EURY|nr:indole-3-glycerol-phosphate synthase [Candidatus Methanoperedens nitroreducens]KCZ71184.1 Indole-3-glycerol phosphate synthase [Candidatus Methanoperedens nitroreducens]MDJ1421438.1 indole-3-glycerol-phosphate synthase [Candidatus Methanoperedens sp.]